MSEVREVHATMRYVYLCWIGCNVQNDYQCIVTNEE